PALPPHAAAWVRYEKRADRGDIRRCRETERGRGFDDRAHGVSVLMREVPSSAAGSVAHGSSAHLRRNGCRRNSASALSGPSASSASTSPRSSLSNGAFSAAT